jgi:hypothetical protein
MRSIRQLTALLAVLVAAPLGAQVRVVNMVPQARSNETTQDAEPNLAINRANLLQLAASAFTPNPTGGANAPIYISSDGGLTWMLNPIVPGNNASYGTGDITLAFGGTSNVLYAGILRGDVFLQLNILRTDNYLSPTAMTVLVSRSADDQPYVEATTAAGLGRDRVYVGNNDVSLWPGRTATVDRSLDAATAPPPAGFGPSRIEPRATASQNGPSIRPAVHADGTVYAAYFGWRAFGVSTITTDVVVVRDDNWGGGATPFTALTDAGDGQAGVRVAAGVNIPSLGTPLGNQRIGSSLAIAVDPRTSGTVYLAWADGANAAGYTVHLRRSTDRGVTWSGDLRAVVGATNPGLAVNAEGTVAFLYQQLASGRWRTHLVLSDDAFATVRDDAVLADFPDNVCPSPCGAGPLGDYAEVIAVGRAFYGVFSGWNMPVHANFPRGVTYQRNVNFTTNTLLALDNLTPVLASVDPFFFTFTPSQGLRPGLSLHAGAAVPLGALNAVNDPGPTINLDVVFPITPKVGVDFRGGYSRFNGTPPANDVPIWDLSVNLKVIPVLSTPYPFVNGGLGVYHVSPNHVEAGFNVGVGLGLPVNPHLDVEATANYHRTFTGPVDAEFLKIQLGLILTP